MLLKSSAQLQTLLRLSQELPRDQFCKLLKSDPEASAQYYRVVHLASQIFKQMVLAGEPPRCLIAPDGEATDAKFLQLVLDIDFLTQATLPAQRKNDVLTPRTPGPAPNTN